MNDPMNKTMNEAMNCNKLTVAKMSEATQEDVAITCTYNILFTNDLACGRIQEMLFELKKSPLYKFKVKQEANRLKKLFVVFERIISEIAGNRIGFLADCNQAIEDECSTHIQNLRESMELHFEVNGQPNARLMSYIECARTFVHMACINIDCRIKDLEKFKLHYANRLNYLRMDEHLRYIDRLSELLFDGGNINLNENVACKINLRRIQSILTSSRMMAKAIQASEDLNYQNPS